MASALPIAAAPTGLRERVFSEAATSRAATLDAGRRPFDSQGWPRPRAGQAPAPRGHRGRGTRRVVGCRIICRTDGRGNVQQVMAGGIPGTYCGHEHAGCRGDIRCREQCSTRGGDSGDGIAEAGGRCQSAGAGAKPSPGDTSARADFPHPDGPVTTYQPPETSAPADSPTSTAPTTPPTPAIRHRRTSHAAAATHRLPHGARRSAGDGPDCTVIAGRPRIRRS